MAWGPCHGTNGTMGNPALSEGLAQGPYVAARAGFEPTTDRSTAIDSANEPPRPTNLLK